METKTYSAIFATSTILAFALIAGIIPSTFVNVLAQEGAITPEGMNNTMSTENATEWTSNVTLAFAQDDTGIMENDTMSINNDTSMMMNATLAYAQGDNATQSQGGNATQSQTGGNMTGLTQGQTGTDDDNGDDGEDDDDDKDNGNDKDDKDEE